VTPEELAAAIRDAVAEAVGVGDLVVEVPDEVQVKRSRGRDHGVWATNVALQLAMPAGMPSRELATRLAGRLAGVVGVLAVEVAGPGFLNIILGATNLVGESLTDLGLEWLVRHRPENPVFSLQYAHARTCRVARLAADAGVHRADGFNPALLSDATETALLAALGASPTSSPRPRSCGNHTGSRVISRTSPHASTGGMTPAAFGRNATSRSPTSIGRASGSTTRPGRSWPTAWSCLVSRHRSGRGRPSRPPGRAGPADAGVGRCDHAGTWSMVSTDWSGPTSLLLGQLRGQVVVAQPGPGERPGAVRDRAQVDRVPAQLGLGDL